MHKNPTQRKEIENRRRFVARLFCEGITNQFAIVDALAARHNITVDQSTVSRDLKVIEAEWKKEAVTEMDTVKSQLRARYEAIYGEAFSAWLRSLEDAETTIQELLDGGGEGDTGKQRLKASTRKEGQSGNPALLAQAQAALKAIREMFGVDAATKQEHKIEDVSLTDDERARRIAAILDRARTRRDRQVNSGD
jgi:hypothetical protein